MEEKNNIIIPSKWLKKYKLELDDYFIVNPNNIDKLKLGGHIKYMTYNGELKNGGFLLSIENKDIFSKLIFVVKSNIVYRLHFTRNFYLYKFPKDKTEEEKEKDNRIKEAIKEKERNKQKEEKEKERKKKEEAKERDRKKKEEERIKEKEERRRKKEIKREERKKEKEKMKEEKEKSI